MGPRTTTQVEISWAKITELYHIYQISFAVIQHDPEAIVAYGQNYYYYYNNYYYYYHYYPYYY